MPLEPRLVIDTSVWINLLATGQPWAITRALGCSCLAPEEVVREIIRDPVTGQPYAFNRHPLRKASALQIAELSDDELKIFLSLVSGPSSRSIGDGEAAVIAVAVSRDCAVAMDDGKARRIIREQYPTSALYMSVDLLRDPNVVAKLGRKGAEEAFARAVQFGRMHVPKDVS